MSLESNADHNSNSSDDAKVSIVSSTESSQPHVGLRRTLPAWGLSGITHALLIALIAVLQVPGSTRQLARIIQLVPDDSKQDVVIEPFDFRALEVGEEAGGGEPGDTIMLPRPSFTASVEPPPLPTGEVRPEFGQEFRDTLITATGEDFFRRFKVKGLAGVGTSSATPAIDRLTREILVSLEERPTLVVWIVDQSASLIPQRNEIQRRLDRIYRELGAIQASGDVGKRHKTPLLSSLIAFGSHIDLCLAEPTAEASVLRDAVAQIARDDSGTERVFGAVLFAVKEFKKFRRPRRGTSEPIRNVMLVIMTDEAGDDPQLLESAVEGCSKLAVPVYVIGVPAPFGQSETLVKWVDPDPDYDQQPSWGPVHQGPETAAVERIRIGSEVDPEHQVPIDSGFGPYALTRLAYETGGIYFAVHADRGRAWAAGRHEVQAFSSHLQVFFDADVMSHYQPDYLSENAYRALVKKNASREALVAAASASWISPLDDPRVRFVVRNEAEFAAALTAAQRAAAVRAPRLRQLYEILKKGEAAGDRETEPRWQAGYDLAMGQVLAELVRNESYNAMLAKAKRGLSFKAPRHNTWTLHAATKIDIDSELQRMGQKALEYLNRVCERHPGTPWSFLAEQQRQRPLGWEWRESHTVLPEERQQMELERRRQMPRDEQPVQVPRKPKRNMPRL